MNYAKWFFILSEKKLLKLQTKSSKSSSAEKRDLLVSLSGTREGHIDRLLNSKFENSCDGDFDQPLDSVASSLIRHIAPHLQAVTTGELVELLKADQLENSETASNLEQTNSDSAPEL